jgi:hypothetical protein
MQQGAKHVEAFGHSDISITYDRYITVYRDRDAEAAEAFAKIVS